MKTVITILMIAAASFAQQKVLNTEEELGGAKSIRAVISLGAVDFRLSRTEDPSKAFVLLYDYSGSDKVPKLNYDVDNEEGTFRLSNDKSNKSIPFFHFNGDKDSAVVQLANSVPLSLNVDFGVCDANVDLGGMKLTDASFGTGVCDFKLNFSTPNKIDCQTISVKTGVSSVTVDNLANARAKRVEVNGGLGSIKLDFGEKLMRNCDVRVKTGLGSVEISIPSDINTTITAPESFLTSVDVSGFYSQGGGVYRSGVKSGPELHIYIESGMGSVSVKSY